MDIFMIRACAFSSPALMLLRRATLATGWLHEPQPNPQSADGKRVFAPCGAVLTRGKSVFVSELLELYGRISDTEMGPIVPDCDGTSMLSRGEILAAR